MKQEGDIHTQLECRLLQRDKPDSEPLWLPPNFTKAKLDDAVARLRKIVGKEGVEYENEAHANAYNDVRLRPINPFRIRSLRGFPALRNNRGG